MKFFDDFADTGFGSWIINVLAVIAGIVAFKILVSRFPDQGVGGSIKAVVNMV